MRFNLQTSKLLYEVRYQNSNVSEDYTYEELYKDINGKYFIHFQGGKESKYAIAFDNRESIEIKGNYSINIDNVDIFKAITRIFQEQDPKEFLVIDWESEEEESLIWISEISEEELPF